MILIADSGSTKTHWEWVNTHNGESCTFITAGINPFYQDTQQIAAMLLEEMDGELKEATPDSIYFYGAGCSQPDKNQTVADALKSLFPQSKINVEHDLLAAARATCGNAPGITCILGTGSNSCLYDGKEIIDNIPSLGFILGDEGSAGWFGRKLLQAYFYRELPEVLQKELEPLSKAEVLNKVHNEEYPNRYVATFAKFISDHRDDVLMYELLQTGFAEFIERHVMKYEGYEHLPIHFIGSMAYNNQEVLEEVIGEKHLHAGRFMQEPMQELIQYHLQNH